MRHLIVLGALVLYISGLSAQSTEQTVLFPSNTTISSSNLIDNTLYTGYWTLDGWGIKSHAVETAIGEDDVFFPAEEWIQPKHVFKSNEALYTILGDGRIASINAIDNEFTLVDSLTYPPGNESSVFFCYPRANTLEILARSRLVTDAGVEQEWHLRYKLDLGNFSITVSEIPINTSTITDVLPLENGELAALYRLFTTEGPKTHFFLYDETFNELQLTVLDGYYADLIQRNNSYILAGTIDNLGRIAVVTSQGAVETLFTSNESTSPSSFEHLTLRDDILYATTNWGGPFGFGGEQNLSLYQLTLGGDLNWEYPINSASNSIMVGTTSFDLLVTPEHRVLLSGLSGTTDVLGTARVFIHWMNPGVVSTGIITQPKQLVFPNPTTGIVRLGVFDAPIPVTVFDQWGQVIKTNYSTGEISLTPLPAGQYYLSWPNEHKQFVVPVIKLQ